MDSFKIIRFDARLDVDGYTIVRKEIEAKRGVHTYRPNLLALKDEEGGFKYVLSENELNSVRSYNAPKNSVYVHCECYAEDEAQYLIKINERVRKKVLTFEKLADEDTWNKLLLVMNNSYDITDEYVPKVHIKKQIPSEKGVPKILQSLVSHLIECSNNSKNLSEQLKDFPEELKYHKGCEDTFMKVVNFIQQGC